MIQLSVSGCWGRMGQRITHLALADKEFKIKTLLEYAGHPNAKEKLEGFSVSTNGADLEGSDVLIEFTTPQATMENLKVCTRLGVKMIIGTTGLNPSQIEEIKKASQKIAIVFSSNMSIGVNIFFNLAKDLAQRAPGNYKVRMVETHHIHKKDAPSGTAKTIAEYIEKNSDHKVADIQSIREGEVVGDHRVIFESDDDIIVLDHHAKSRDIFATGSLVAAKFIAKKKKGLFTMQEVLGLS